MPNTYGPEMIPVSKNALIRGRPVFFRLVPICFDARAINANPAVNTKRSMAYPKRVSAYNNYIKTMDYSLNCKPLYDFSCFVRLYVLRLTLKSAARLFAIRCKSIVGNPY
jgi:hypothetical protein